MKYLYLIIIGILIALALWLYLRPQDELKDIDVTQLTKTLQDKAKKHEDVMISVIVKAKQDSVRNSEKEKVYITTITKLEKRIQAQKQKPEVITVLNENPETALYVQFLDSMIQHQDMRIDTLNKEKAEQWASFNQLITASDSTAQANKELNELMIDIEKAKTKKAKNKRFALGPYLGYDVIKNRPSVGVSVHFDLIRF